MRKEPKILLEELFSEEYEQYAQRALRDNEAVHNVRGPTVDLSLWNDTQVSEEN